jgi:hypothetical protein
MTNLYATAFCAVRQFTDRETLNSNILSIISFAAAAFATPEICQSICENSIKLQSSHETSVQQIYSPAASPPVAKPGSACSSMKASTQRA